MPCVSWYGLDITSVSGIPDEYKEGLLAVLKPFTDGMTESVNAMADKAGMTREEFFDAAMSAFTDAGHVTVGATGSLKDSQVYAVAPSYMPDRMTGTNESFRRGMGIPFLAYAIDTKKNFIMDTSSHGETVQEGDIAEVVYGGSFSFVMFPSKDVIDYAEAVSMPSYKAGSLVASVEGVPVGTEVGMR